MNEPGLEAQPRSSVVQRGAALLKNYIGVSEPGQRLGSRVANFLTSAVMIPAMVGTGVHMARHPEQFHQIGDQVPLRQEVDYAYLGLTPKSVVDQIDARGNPMRDGDPMRRSAELELSIIGTSAAVIGLALAATRATGTNRP